jgi:hypothetical protein
MRKILLFCLTVFCFQSHFAQGNCTGAKLFTEKSCAGDEINTTERELFRLINEYRAESKLPPVAMSEPLSLVANRHLLDLTLNLKYLTHGWSNCPYDIKKEDTWNCIFQSPQRLNTGYTGQGFENLYRNLNGNASPVSALEAWKKSPIHNNLILNLDIWNKTKFDAFGVAVSGNYAAIWFGSKSLMNVEIDQEVEGLGVSFEKLVSGLSTILSINKTESLGESGKWVGKSADNSIRLEIYGKEKDIAETTLALSVKLGRGAQISPQSRSALLQFLANIAPNWRDREKWVDAALTELARNPKIPQSLTIGKKTFVFSLNAANVLNVVVKPAGKKQAREL